MLKLCSNGVQGLLSFHLKSAFLYSTSSKASHLLANYLVKSLGFSRDEAISASKKGGRFKSKENADSVIDFLNQGVLDKAQIHKLISSVPMLLNIKVDKTLKPKIRVFIDLGLSWSDLVTLFASDPSIISRGLESHLLPLIDFMKSILGSDEAVANAIKKTCWLLSGTNLERMKSNVALLENYGLSRDRIRKLLIHHPKCLIYHTQWLEECLVAVEETWGIPRHSTMFEWGFPVMATFNKANLQSKYEIFKSYGWSEADILTMARKLSRILRLSDASIRNRLNFFMNELGYEPGYLASHPRILTYSMEKRVVPRNTVLQVLKARNLVKPKTDLYRALCFEESQFLDKFVMPYKDVLPQLYEAYTNNKMGCLVEAEVSMHPQ
ncbi:hypothetical protein Ancab_015464 [Ancistrocladus abbreviatus]